MQKIRRSKYFWLNNKVKFTNIFCTSVNTIFWKHVLLRFYNYENFKIIENVQRILPGMEFTTRNFIIQFGIVNGYTCTSGAGKSPVKIINQTSQDFIIQTFAKNDFSSDFLRCLKSKHWKRLDYTSIIPRQSTIKTCSRWHNEQIHLNRKESKKFKEMVLAACCHIYNWSTSILLKVTFCFEHSSNQTTIDCGLHKSPADF